MKTSENIPHGKNKLQLLSTYSIVSGREVLKIMDCPDQDQFTINQRMQGEQFTLGTDQTFIGLNLELGF